jgi:hypothetical protein
LQLYGIAFWALMTSQAAPSAGAFPKKSVKGMQRLQNRSAVGDLFVLSLLWCT